MINWHESDIEDFLYENYKSTFGTHFILIGRQVNIDIGVIDLLLFNINENSLVVVEIKKDAIRESALTQIMRYIQGIRDYLSDTELSVVENVKGILIGPEIVSDAITSLRMINDLVEFYKCNIQFSVNIELISYERNKELDSYKPLDFERLFKERVINTINQLSEAGEENG